MKAEGRRPQMTREEEIIGFPIKDEAALTTITGPGFIACTCIGVAPMGDIWMRRRGELWEARQHVAIMGGSDEDCAAEGKNPFGDDFTANHARGVGATQKAAIEALVKDRKSMADGLFA